MPTISKYAIPVHLTLGKYAIPVHLTVGKYAILIHFTMGNYATLVRENQMIVCFGGALLHQMVPSSATCGWRLNVVQLYPCHVGIVNNELSI